MTSISPALRDFLVFEQSLLAPVGSHFVKKLPKRLVEDKVHSLFADVISPGMPTPPHKKSFHARRAVCVESTKSVYSLYDSLSAMELWVLFDDAFAEQKKLELQHTRAFISGKKKKLNLLIGLEIKNCEMIIGVSEAMEKMTIADVTISSWLGEEEVNLCCARLDATQKIFELREEMKEVGNPESTEEPAKKPTGKVVNPKSTEEPAEKPTGISPENLKVIERGCNSQ